MLKKIERLVDKLKEVLGNKIDALNIDHDQICIDIGGDNLIEVATLLRDDAKLQFQQLLDLCGIDYSQYNNNEWATDKSSATGFSRAVEPASHGYLNFGDDLAPTGSQKHRFATLYQLISYALNHRVTLRVFAENEDFPAMQSVVAVWNSANWYERESFDLFGIHYSGHPDLRRILTDYGFVGHPFRKDFPLVGRVEMRYDEKQKRVIYEPVSIEPRVLVPRVHREDHRYIEDKDLEDEDIQNEASRANQLSE